MEKHIINTDPNEFTIDGEPFIVFQADSFELSNGTMHHRFMKIDARKEYSSGFYSYETREKWQAAIKRVQKQYAQFN